MADATCLQLRPPAADTAWKPPVPSKAGPGRSLGNRFIHRARAREDRGEHRAAGEEDPTQRAGTKRTFPTAFGTGSAGTQTAATQGGSPREEGEKTSAVGSRWWWVSNPAWLKGLGLAGGGGSQTQHGSKVWVRQVVMGLKLSAAQRFGSGRAGWTGSRGGRGWAAFPQRLLVINQPGL